MKNKIDPKPQYQRSPVWSLFRKQLLINSIFKGFDLPKIYLNTLKNNSLFEFEVADGQQRLRAIWEYVEGEFGLMDTDFKGRNLSGKRYKELKKDEKEIFDDFELTIAFIRDASPDEVRTLFSRLQMGVGLNQAELRRALISSIGTYVQSLVENHNFFKKCRIPNIRNKHQDYVDHCIAYLHSGNGKNLKGIDLKDAYTDISLNQADLYLKSIAKVLSVMEVINDIKPGIFKNKWAFVDVFILIHDHNVQGFKVKHIDLEATFSKFESRRRNYGSRTDPSPLIKGANISPENERLYKYIMAFNKDGALSENIAIRATVFAEEFKNCFVQNV